MTRIRIALTKSQEAAIKTPRSARALVEGMNREIGYQKEEIVNLRANYADIQNKYEDMQARYHRLDKHDGILGALHKTQILTEVIKYLLSAIGTGVGINMATGGNGWGWIVVAGSAVCYILVTYVQSSSQKDESE